MNIIELAKEAGLQDEYGITFAYPERLERFAALVRAEREWVGLTDEEVNEIIHEKVMDMRMTYKDLVGAVIAAWKAKNGIN